MSSFGVSPDWFGDFDVLETTPSFGVERSSSPCHSGTRSNFPQRAVRREEPYFHSTFSDGWGSSVLHGTCELATAYATLTDLEIGTLKSELDSLPSCPSINELALLDTARS